ncbi:type II toxin-antitoxin system HipA family toxin [Agilicoccus flavus]|uniref:type II toxin-antitoxin system HipA family toxin n=1 Tax=Agilicoccus flavus TaxID=2775968 RepID=UPI001CF6D100|nr:HipA domain-containing protein [Agilicoccus flavus]
MSVELTVELYDTVVGVAAGPDWRSTDISFTPEALTRWGVNSPVLSVGAPLELRPHRRRAPRRRNVLGELLPEGVMRERLARMGGLATHDVAGLLARFGRDVAGAVQVYDPEASWGPPVPQLRPIDDAAIARLLDEVALGNDPRRGKTSLAGVQPKIVLTREGGQWHQPLGGATSTHIVKPALPGRPQALAEEEYGHRLAVSCGLSATSVEVERLGGRDCLAIERYDRVGPERQRLHQEDFNQALGLAGDEKYQEIGGSARLGRVAEVVAQHAPDDLGRLAAHLTLAVAIGNLDLHAKNLGLLHPPDGSSALAPAYDMLPLAHLPGIDGRMAMAVDGEYALAALSIGHLEREVDAWGVDPAVVRSALERIGDGVDREKPLAPADRLRPMIAAAVARLLAGEPLGDTFTPRTATS